MTVRFVHEAETELKAAVTYCNEKRLGLGLEFAEVVREALGRIEEYPHAWKLIGQRVRSCGLRRFPYGIVYVPLPSEIVILAVMHLRRKPEYWAERIKRD